MTGQTDYILEAVRISKRYGGVRALDAVDLRLKRGEILALVGDNGAGKSTLIKSLSGTIKPDEGQIFFEGRQVEIANPRQAKALGIETVHQDLNLIDNQNVAFNVFLGREITYGGPLGVFGLMNKRKMIQETSDLLSRLNISLGRLDRPVRDYSGGQRQAAAIAKLAYWGTKVAIFDEPTAALGVQESAKALDLIKMMNQKLGLSIIIISHNLQHVFNLVDRIAVLRKGRLVAVEEAAGTTSHDIVRYITGASELDHREKEKATETLGTGA